MAEQKLEKEEEFITVQVQIFKPFYEFIKAYLDFFALPEWTVEDFIRQAVYDSAMNIFQAVKELNNVRENGAVTHIPKDQWLRKWKIRLLFPDMELPEEDES